MFFNTFASEAEGVFGPRRGEVYLTVANLGEGPGEPAPLFLDQAEARGAEKKFLRPGPLLSRSLDDRLHPYLKVRIRHCLRNEHKVQGCPRARPSPFQCLPMK